MSRPSIRFRANATSAIPTGGYTSRSTRSPERGHRRQLLANVRGQLRTPRNAGIPAAQQLDNQVPYLKNSFEWDAFVSADGAFSTSARTLGRVRLIQIDVAVKDNRGASTSGWVYGTFNYNAAAAGATPWQPMVPIGLMWGNDPTLTPPDTARAAVLNKPRRFRPT
jgi:hypothetical protein